MSRYLTVAAAQLGPVQRDEPRASVVGRLIALLEQGKRAGCDLVVFPEMALTTFFPRWYMADIAEASGFFERAMPSDQTRPLFQAATRLGVGFYLGYCEMLEEAGRTRRFNSAVLVDQKGRIIGKYRKVHVPGNRVYDPKLPYQHMEPYYFEDGDLGFPVWQAFGTTVGMAICNDRRWPETYRVMALKGAELIVLGFNSPSQLPEWPDQNVLRVQHHLVCMQAAAYQNGLWIVASSKAGREEGVDMMGHSCIVSPSSDVVALSQSLGDELIPYRCDLDLAPYYKSFFGLDRNRKPEHYGIITEIRSQREAAQ